MAPTISPFPLSLQTGQDVKANSLPTPTSASNLTPPVTPVGRDSGESARSIPSPIHNAPSEKTVALLRRTVWTPLRFTDAVEISRDDEDRPIEFGRGAWSIVYKARSTPSAPTSAPHTPPSSPVAISRVYAVKAPLRRDARPVLQAEALTLTRLHRTPGCENYVVPFHGYHTDSEALVMSAVPLALSTFIEDQADLMRKRQSSTATMFDPVQGPNSWRDLARKLISGLAWLHHTAAIIHGDVKPHNLLLRPIPTDEPGTVAGAFPYEPLFADFSSAVEIPFESAASPDTTRASMSAFTPPFTAPELLSLASLKSGDVAPTPASDVFSLAATLLAAATGDLLLYPGSSNMQRLAMAREGHRILEFTRSGNNGFRIPRNGFVEKLVQPAVAKDPAQRIDAQQWMAIASST
ncbi:uncharacterized protein N7459_000363 [Penicillium hispanicum]|uniref:uncharacterized protein n=1 Tax=Penicillium hispanicum TaxID=1080232 RepID=UPI0025400EB4|nr:uncharacterized protein N7459_000363 [Penicillium hispanicum]KAJ5594155.1 hypothetical protein N7459_000363 [Penicillium hispanicum]